LIKMVCPRCGSTWYEESLEAVLKKVEGKWGAWEPYMTKQQRRMVALYNNSERLKEILKKKGHLKMFCIGCAIDITRRLSHGRK